MDSRKVMKYLRVSQQHYEGERNYFLRMYHNWSQIPKIMKEESLKDLQAFDRVVRVIEMQNVNWSIDGD